MTNIEIGVNLWDRDARDAARDWGNDESPRLGQRGRDTGSHVSETHCGSRGRKALPGVGVLSVVVWPLAALHVCLLMGLMLLQCCEGVR